MLLTLKQIINDDPDAVGYSGMTHELVAADINDKRHPQRHRVSFIVFNQALLDEGIMLAVVQAKLDPTHAAYGTAALVMAMIDRAMQSGILNIDMDKPGNDALFDAMTTANLMTAAQRVILEALADSQASLADQNGLGFITAGEVQAARMP